VTESSGALKGSGRGNRVQLTIKVCKESPTLPKLQAAEHLGSEKRGNGLRKANVSARKGLKESLNALPRKRLQHKESSNRESCDRCVSVSDKRGAGKDSGTRLQRLQVRKNSDEIRRKDPRLSGDLDSVNPLLQHCSFRSKKGKVGNPPLGRGKGNRKVGVCPGRMTLPSRHRKFSNTFFRK